MRIVAMASMQLKALMMNDICFKEDIVDIVDIVDIECDRTVLESMR